MTESTTGVAYEPYVDPEEAKAAAFESAAVGSALGVDNEEEEAYAGFEIKERIATTTIPVFDRKIAFRTRFGALAAREENQLQSKIASLSDVVRSEKTSRKEKEDAYIQLLDIQNALFKLYCVDDTDRAFLLECMQEEHGPTKVLDQESINILIRVLRKRADLDLEEETGKA